MADGFNECDRGYCATCRHNDGVDEANDVCICDIDDPHRDWRYHDNEPCENWDDERSRA